MELEYHMGIIKSNMCTDRRHYKLIYEDLFVFLCTYPTRLPILNSCSDYCKMMVSLIRFKQQVDAFIMYGHEYMGVLVAERPTFTYIYFILHQITRSGQVGLRCLVTAGHHTIDRSMLDDHYWSPWLRDAQLKLGPNESNSTTTRLQVFRQETWDSYNKHNYYIYIYIHFTLNVDLQMSKDCPFWSSRLICFSRGFAHQIGCCTRWASRDWKNWVHEGDRVTGGLEKVTQEWQRSQEILVGWNALMSLWKSYMNKLHGEAA